VARIIDTTPAFEDFAKKAFLDPPLIRDGKWRSLYEGSHPEVFEAFAAAAGPPQGTNPLVRELSRVREQAANGARAMKQIIEEVDPSLAKALGVARGRSPVHVLLVGRFSTNAAVGRLDGDVALFHCLEWYQSPESSKVMVAHEGTHAWHELLLEAPPPEDDAAWMAFSEGLAVRVSRSVVPDRPEEDYFWYGHPGFEDWLPWCQEHRDQLMERFAASLDEPRAVEAFFGGGLVDGKWRVGYFVADQLVAGLGLGFAEMAGMSPDEGSAVIRDALGPAGP
jgi:hypothetical protein